MTDRPVRIVAVELVNDLDVLVGEIRRLVRAEVEGSVIAGRSYEATGKSKFTPDKDGNPSGPTETRAAAVDPVLAKTVKKLEAAIRSVRGVEQYLVEPDPDQRTCIICQCRECRAVHPRSDPKRCDSCYRWQLPARYGRDRTADEVRAHKEQMRAREADRAEQERRQRRAG